jgi:hypothetical protein
MEVVIRPNLELEAIRFLRNYYDRNDYDHGSEIDGKQVRPGIGNQRVMRVARRMITMLFKDLTKSL